MNKINLSVWSKTLSKPRNAQSIRRAGPKHLRGTHTCRRPNATRAKSGVDAAGRQVRPMGCRPAIASAGDGDGGPATWLMAPRGARGARFSSLRPIICGRGLGLGLGLGLGEASATSQGNGEDTGPRSQVGNLLRRGGVRAAVTQSRVHPEPSQLQLVATSDASLGRASFLQNEPIVSGATGLGRKDRCLPISSASYQGA